MDDAVQRVRDADTRLAEIGPTPFPVPVGAHDVVVAGALTGLSASDWWVPGVRERVGAVLRGAPIERLVDAFAGARPYKVAPPLPSPANRALAAVGLALSAPDAVALVHLGVGSLSDGAVAEALNLAALQGARVIFLVSVPVFDDGAPVGAQSAADPVLLAAAYGVPGVAVDGGDVAAVQGAVRTARASGGPFLIRADLPSPSSRDAATGGA
jgi:TPP-dependent pyruvate/acetoin dehydrogenase alpha subunit